VIKVKVLNLNPYKSEFGIMPTCRLTGTSNSEIALPDLRLKFQLYNKLRPNFSILQSYNFPIPQKKKPLQISPEGVVQLFKA
jgi:hypothetical protein